MLQTSRLLLHKSIAVFCKMPKLVKVSGDPKAFIDNAIKENKVMVFSKSSCPYCHRAKAALDDLTDDYVVCELDKESACSAMQDYLSKLTGGRSVPRVFIGGKFIGGGDETAAAKRSGELEKMLVALGVIEA